MTNRKPTSRDYFRLRAEWLRFKNRVFDSNTGLPTLAAMMDDVRRLIEESGTVTLIYLDLGGDPQLETLHGWHAYDEMLRAFARVLTRLRTHGAIDAHDVVGVSAVRSDKFLVFLGNTEPATSARLDRLTESLHTFVNESFPPYLRKLCAAPRGFNHGRALIRRDPMVRAEGAIQQALDEAMLMSLRLRSREQDLRERELGQLIAEERVTTTYQPILDLREGRVLGYEAMCSAASDSSLVDRTGLFALAERSGRLPELERLCRRKALAGVRHLDPGPLLFLSTSAAALRDPEIEGGGLARQVQKFGLRPADVVLEVTERVAAEGRRQVQRLLQELKNEGFGLAIDDMGAGYSSLQSIAEIEPGYLKFDVSLVRDIDHSLIKRSLLETLVDISERVGAEVIADGIEAESELITLTDMGVRLGQGRHLGRPRSISEQAQ